jgi:hypothetical protein
LDGAEPSQGVSFTGRVVDLETGKPIEDVAILVERSLRGAGKQPTRRWPGQTVIRSDADGRFQLAFPAGHVTGPGLKFTLTVRHPGFIPRKTWETDLAVILRRQAVGDRPFFETIRLEKGVEYNAQIVTPTGKPAADIPWFFENWSGGNNDSRGFHNEYLGRTDADGWFRLRSPKSRAIALYLLPLELARASFPYAPHQQFWGTDRPPRNPDVWAPTDLGRIVLTRGVRLPGRLVDLAGRPIAGQAITAFSSGKIQHSAVTEADGTFVLGPLRYGNYWIHGARQDGFCYVHWDMIYGKRRDGFDSVNPSAPSVRSQTRVIMPAKVYLKEGITPEPVLLRELPTAQVTVKFIDSRGNPAPGGHATIEGTIPSVPGARQSSLMYRLASAINEPEPEDSGELIEWRTEARPDALGRVVFRTPHGLQDATINAVPIDETIAYKTRFKEDGPLHAFGGAGFGILDRDREVTIVSYKAATMLVTVKTDDGGTLTNTNVGANFNLNMCTFGNNFAHQTDGRYRGNLMPDHEYRICATADDYVPNTVPRLKLPEGGLTELTVTLRRRPAPPETGKPAPPFSTKTIDGRPLTLDVLRGKFALLHFWTPHPSLGLTEMAHLKAVADRCGAGNPFIMVSVCLDHDPEVGLRLIKESGLPLEQVVLRDSWLSTMAVDYTATPPPKSFLIGPDGTLISKDLKGDQIEKAVATALAVKMPGIE